jgi:hypothetical protein
LSVGLRWRFRARNKPTAQLNSTGTPLMTKIRMAKVMTAVMPKL